MDSETALNVAWIGVLAGVAGGGIAGLVQYVIHRIGSRLRWRDLLRDAATEFASMHDTVALSYLFDGAPATEDQKRDAHFALNRLMLLAPPSVELAAHNLWNRSAQMMDELRNGKSVDDEEWLAPTLNDLGKHSETFIRETRNVLKAGKRRA